MRKRDIKRNIWEELELGLGGGKKFKLLLHLALNPEKAFTKYSLSKATGLRTPSVERRLKALMEIGWVKENPYKPKTYQINLENEVVAMLVRFLKDLQEKSVL